MPVTSLPPSANVHTLESWGDQGEGRRACRFLEPAFTFREKGNRINPTPQTLNFLMPIIGEKISMICYEMFSYLLWAAPLCTTERTLAQLLMLVSLVAC
jgi:hypothetical protein